MTPPSGLVARPRAFFLVLLVGILATSCGRRELRLLREIEGAEKDFAGSRYPHLPRAEHAGWRVSELMSVVDLMPTLLSLVGIEPPSEVQGQDVSGLLFGDTVGGDDAVYCSAAKNAPTLYGICTLGHKLLLDIESDECLLFDLDSDPDELRNIARQNPSTGERLRQQLLRHLEEMAALEPLAREEAPVFDDLRQRLKALGYVR